MQNTVHLRVPSGSSGRSVILNKLQLGERTMYSVIETGVCGGSELNPIVYSVYGR